MIDATARGVAVDSSGSVLVQAPAGSGKTTLLVQRYLRLLSVVDSPERILALTFTRRAAQEMRERVLHALLEARAAACPPAMNARTFELAQAAARQLNLRGIDVQLQPTRLRIETIDAFNAWLANQLPVAAGSVGMKVIEDAAPSYQEAARRALGYEGNDAFAGSVERVLGFNDQRWRSLVKLIAEMLPSRDRWLKLLAGRLHAAAALDAGALRTLRAHFDEDLELLIARALARAREVLGAEMVETLAALMRAAAPRLAPEHAALLAPWQSGEGSLRSAAGDAGRWRSVAELVLTKDGKIRASVDKRQGFPPNAPDKPRMKDVLAELAARPLARELLCELRSLPQPQYDEAQWERARDVAQVLILAAAELDMVFRERGAVDFTAVSMAAQRALGTPDEPTDLNLWLDYRLQHLLIDEFQDTSSAQLDFVEKLTAGWQCNDGRSIFCVGDPMQSIYGFRQAEVRAFLELAEQGIGEVRFALERLQSNFRSNTALVDWVNRCFAGIMPAEDDRARGAIAFRPSHAARAAGAGGVRVESYQSRAEEAERTAAAVAEARRRHPDWRIAILVRARLHAKHIAAGLRAQSVDFRSVQIEALQDRAVVRDIVMLARSLSHLGDRTAWLAILRAPWAGLSLQDLLLLAPQPIIYAALREPAVLEALSTAGRARLERLRAVLEAALMQSSTMPFARLVESAWLRLGGPACLSAKEDLGFAESAFRRLRDLEADGMPDPAELQAAFDDLFADQGGEAAVEIMTIHKAKGLEFDMVIVPALERPVSAHREQLLIAHSFARTGREGMVLAGKPPVGGEEDPLFEFLRDQQRQASALEAQRLMYVACTRAKSELLLSAVIDPQPEKEFQPKKGSLLSVLWPAAGPQFRSSVPETFPGMGAPEQPPRGGALQRLPLGWQPAAFLPAPDWLAADVSDSSETEWPLFDWAGETARRIGSLVHAELQGLSVGVDEANLRSRQSYYRRWLAAHGVPEERLSAASTRVVEALVAVNRDPRGQWLLNAGYRDDYREHALSGQHAGELVRAVFDRTFIDEAGIRWVIDYKTSQHSGGGLEEFLDREVERYRPQLARYAQLARKMGPEPVRLALYFPLMRAWREWPAEA